MIIVQCSYMRYFVIVWLLFATLINSCNDMKPSFEVIVEQVRIFDSIPSGSGLVIEGDSLFVMGDDATSLYKISISSGIVSAVPLANTDQTKYRITKPDKHDLESLSLVVLNGQKYIAAFGSGSVSPQRDSLLLTSVVDDHQQQWISLGNFYATLRKQSSKKELNIEGVVANSDKIYLFNRSGSEIYELNLESFEAIVNSKDSLGEIEVKKHLFQLPSSGGVQSALSGGCLLNDRAILFCASSENLPNVYDDGDIQGSYVGIISIGKDELSLKEMVEIKDVSGKVLRDKLESIDIAGRYSNGDIRAFAVADNDDGRSKLFELRIRYTTPGSKIR
jgi:hypothetical protein